MDPVRASVLVDALVGRVLGWYAESARNLPWRRPGTSPYAVLVSEVMLQQTPVARVEPAYLAWLERWPTVASLAAAPSGEAVRQWGRLGYPRRALRLHAAATACVANHEGAIPSEYDELIALPGVGAYTAAAVASFAFGQAHPVLDTNVRRVLARTVVGLAQAPASPRVSERRLAMALLPSDGTAALWSVAVMELGALVCTSRKPRCSSCPIEDLCVWRRQGQPAASGPARRAQSFTGTDRQVRGMLMDVLRESRGPVTAGTLDLVWADEVQRDRALEGLLRDGLAVRARGGYTLPE